MLADLQAGGRGREDQGNNRRTRKQLGVKVVDTLERSAALCFLLCELYEVFLCFHQLHTGKHFFIIIHADELNETEP